MLAQQKAQFKLVTSQIDFFFTDIGYPDIVPDTEIHRYNIFGGGINTF